MKNILAVSQDLAEKGYPKYVEIPEAAFYALLGFFIVIVGISFLILILWAVGKFMHKGAANPVASTKSPVSLQAKEQPTVRDSVAEDEISEETIAVITAAIAAYYERTAPKCEFTVKRIKRF